MARYHLKKVGSVVEDDHYTNKFTGEILKPEYITMSRRPGIGAGWYDKFKSDVYPRDSRVIKGVDTKPCKFYDSRYELENPSGYERVKLARLRNVDRSDNTQVRLDVKEKVKLAQIASLSTSLEDVYK